MLRIVDPSPVPDSPPEPSIGRLREGLAELDARRGMSRAGAALQASYLAARDHAPRQGIGVFEVVSDADGNVTSVRLVSSGPDAESWQRVAVRLRELLR
jgi:hypothetical protein